MRKKTKDVALGGIMAALAVVIMCMGGLIPIATFVCPMLCMVLLVFVFRSCGRRIAWAWYGAVSILSVLLGPDKEAAAVFLFLGYYPIIKPQLDRLRLKWLWKLLLFNGAILLMYWLLMGVFGMTQLSAEFEELGTVLTAVMLLLGNVIFFMLDHLLDRLPRKKR